MEERLNDSLLHQYNITLTGAQLALNSLLHPLQMVKCLRLRRFNRHSS